MPRLIWLESAQDDLVDISEFIAAGSGSRTVARRFVGRLRKRCAALARQPVTLGTPRPDLAPGLRSFAIGRYVIFFRYVGSYFEVVNVVEGHRDIAALFKPEERDERQT